MDLLAIPFRNDLGYDVSILDSFKPDNASDAENNYLGHLTALGTVKAKTTSVLKPIRSASVFIFQNASTGEPLARSTRGPLSQKTAYAVGQPDEDAMTTTIKFISFLMFNPDHPMTKAFYALWHEDSAPLMQTIDAFFDQYPDYQSCTFQTYLMGITYISAHPEAVITPFPVHSLSGLVKHWGGTWPDGLPDITISHFSFSFKNNLLQLGIYIDLSTLPYETPQVADNIKKLGYGDTTVKVTLQTNFQLSLGIFGTRLTVDFDDFGIPVGDNESISIKKPEVTIDINPLFKFVVFTLKGTIPFKANNTNLDANISLTVDNEEAHIGAVIAGDGCSFPAPPGLKGLFFDEAGLGMGLFFKPPAFAFGVETKFHIGTPKSGNIIALDNDTATMIFKTEGDIPVPLFLSFYIPKIDANEVLELFTNVDYRLDLPVSFTNLSFKWSESLMTAVVMPDGSLAPAGYAFSANVDILSFQLYGDASLDLSNGLKADIEMSPLHWKNIFSLTGDSKGTFIKVDGAGNPIKNNFIPTTQAEKDAVANATTKQITTPGGPVLIINTLSLPILHLNAKASLFDLLEYDITADINKDGIKFELDYGAVLTKKMVCNLTNFHNLYAELGYYIDKSIPLPTINGINVGSIPLKADIDAHLSITTSITDVVISTGGQFDFEGYHFTFGDFTADISISKMADFIAAIGQHIADEAKSIFSPILDTAEHWAAAAGKGIVTGFDDAGKVMKNAYGKTKEEMASILKEAGFAANDIANGLKNAYGATKQDVAALMKGASYLAGDVASALRTAFAATSDGVADALKKAGYTAEEVGGAIKGAWDNIKQIDVGWAMMIVNFAPTDVAKGVRSAFNATSDGVANVLKSLNYKAEDVGTAIKGAWVDCKAIDVGWAMMIVNFAATDVAKGVRSAFGATTDCVADVLKRLKYKAEDVGTAIRGAWNCLQIDVAWAMMIVNFTETEVAQGLRSAFNTTSDGVADVLKKLNYKAEAVATAIKGTWNCEKQDVAWAMMMVGYAASDISRSLQAAFGATEQDIANAFKAVGIAAQDTANLLQNDFHKTINEAAAIMKQAGYATNDVASALKTAFNTSVDAVSSAMKQVGYAADDVKNAFESLGGDFKNFADKVWDKLNPKNW